MWFFITLVLSLFDIYIVYSFYNSLLKRRIRKEWFVLGTFLAFVLLDILKALEFWPTGIALISLIAYYSLTFFFVTDWRQRIAYPSLLIVFALGAEFIAGIFTQAFLGMSLAEITADITSFPYLVGATVAKLLYLLAVQITRRIHVRAGSPIPFSNWIIVMCVPIISILIQYGLAMGYQNSSEMDGITTILMLLGILAMNVLAFIAYDRLSALTHSLIENERMQNALKSDMRQYETTVQHGNEMTGYVHDIKYQMEYIFGLLPEQAQEAKSYIQKHHLTPQSIYDDIIVPNNNPVDYLLRKKIAVAENFGIKVEYDIIIPKDINISDVVLCVILGNALDNAIEACNRVDNNVKRVIRIIISHRYDKFVIRIENSSNPVVIKDELCESSKNDPLLHGFGLINMKKIITENKGLMLIDFKEGIFFLKIIFMG